MGFIEELPENTDTNQQPEEEAPFIRVLHDMNSLLGPLISGSLAGATTRYNFTIRCNFSNNIKIVLVYFSYVNNDSSADGSTSTGNQGGRRGPQRRGPISFEDILQEILVSITDGNASRASMFFNPGKITINLSILSLF